MTWRIKDVGASLKGVLARIPEVIVAAAGNDNVEIDGPRVDRRQVGGDGDVGRLYLSGKVLIEFSAALDAAETLSIAANLQDSADGSVFADLVPAQELALAVVATGGAGGTTEQGVAELDVDLTGARRFIRLQSTADLSRGATDTVAIGASFALGGADELPAQ